MAQISKYPGEQTVALRVPTRLAHCLENSVIPYLLAQVAGGVVDDIVVVNLTELQEYRLHGEPAYRRKHIYDTGCIVLYHTRTDYHAKVEQVKQAYTSNPGCSTGQKAEELIS